MASEINYDRIGVVQGVQPTGATARFGNELQNFFGNKFLAEAKRVGAEKGNKAGLAAAKNIVMTRDSNGNIAPVDESIFKKSGTAFGDSFNNALVTNYGAALVSDSKRQLDDFQKNNPFDIKAFSNKAQAYITGITNGLPGRIKDAVALRIEESFQQSKNNIHQNIFKKQQAQSLSSSIVALSDKQREVTQTIQSGGDPSRLIDEANIQIKSMLDANLIDPLKAQALSTKLAFNTAYTAIEAKLVKSFKDKPDSFVEDAAKIIDKFNGKSSVVGIDGKKHSFSGNNLRELKNNLHNRKNQLINEQKLGDAVRRTSALNEYAADIAAFTKKVNDGELSNQDAVDLLNKGNEFLTGKHSDPTMANKYFSLSRAVGAKIIALQNGRLSQMKKEMANSEKVIKFSQILANSSDGTGLNASPSEINAAWNYFDKNGGMSILADPNKQQDRTGQSTGKTPEELAINAIEKSGVMPNVVKRDMESMIRAANPDVIVQNADLIKALSASQTVKSTLSPQLDRAVERINQVILTNPKEIDRELKDIKLEFMDNAGRKKKVDEINSDVELQASISDNADNIQRDMLDSGFFTNKLSIASQAPGATDFFRFNEGFNITHANNLVRILDSGPTWLSKTFSSFTRQSFPIMSKEFNDTFKQTVIDNMAAGMEKDQAIAKAKTVVAEQFIINPFAKFDRGDNTPTAQLIRKDKSIPAIYQENGFGSDGNNLAFNYDIQKTVEKAFNNGDVPYATKFNNGTEMFKGGQVTVRIIPGTANFKIERDSNGLVKLDKKGQAISGPQFEIHMRGSDGFDHLLSIGGKTGFRPTLRDGFLASRGDTIEEARIDKLATESATKDIQKIAAKHNLKSTIFTFGPVRYMMFLREKNRLILSLKDNPNLNPNPSSPSLTDPTPVFLRPPVL